MSLPVLQKLCSMMLGTLLLMAASPWQQLAGQEKQPNGSQTRVFQSVIGDKSTLKSLFELARPIPRRAEFVNHFIALELAARSYKEHLKEAPLYLVHRPSGTTLIVWMRCDRRVSLSS